MSNSTEIDGWTVTAYPTGPVFKVIAMRTTSKGKIALHVEKLSAEQVATFDPTARWGGPLAPCAMGADIAEMLA